MEAKSNSFLKILKFVGIAYLMTLIFLVIFAALLVYTNVPESFMDTGVLIIILISILISSFLSVKKTKENGLKNGAIIGAAYILILYVLSSVFVTGFSLTAYSIVTIILSGIIGMIGGIIGVNI